MADRAEHWLPRGLGAVKDSSLLSGRLCRDCNQTLGRTLDEELIRTGPTGFFRAALGIKGRKGHSDVSPFYYRNTQSVPPTSMAMPSPSGEYTFLTELTPSGEQRSSARPLRQIIVRRSDGTLVPVPFPKAWQTEQLRKALDSRNLLGAELVDVYLGPDESGEDPDSPDSLAVRRTLTDLFGRFRARVWFGDGKGEFKPAAIAVGFSRTYLRALAKVAFHYLLWADKAWTGHESHFDAARRFIRHDEGDWKFFVLPVAPPFITPLKEGYLPRRHTHYLLADSSPTEVRVGMQFFVGPDSNPPPPPAAVRLAIAPSAIGERRLVAHQVRYFEQKTDGYDAELSAVVVTADP